MATFVIHFLTIVGRPGDEAAEGIEALKAIRRRLATDDTDGDFEDQIAAGEDPLTGWSNHDEPIITAFCEGLLATVHRLPTLCYSQFVYNFAGPRHLLGILGPNPLRSFGPARQALHGLNYDLHYFKKADTPSTLAAIEQARRYQRPGGTEPKVVSDIDSRMFLDHLQAALEQAHWLPFTVVVISQCIGATREGFEIEDAIHSSLGLTKPELVNSASSKVE